MRFIKAALCLATAQTFSGCNEDAKATQIEPTFVPAAPNVVPASGATQAELDQLKSHATDYTQKVAETQERINESEQKIADLRRSIAEWQARIDHLRAEKVKLERGVSSETVTAAMGMADPCFQVCMQDETCRTDKHVSYCKTWQTPPVCFAYYFNEASKTDGFYYHTEANPGKQDVPMTCEDASKMIGSTGHADYCTLLCTVDPQCMAAGKGSWSKLDHNPVTCQNYVINNSDPRGFSYWTGVGDDSIPMTPAQARLFYERITKA